jgi:SAM-dependent methyltransferase
VEYFNGGLFSRPARLELRTEELNQLKTAADYDWSKVRPEIFGTIFEHSLGTEERRAFGCHFTHPTDIMKIVGPTIVRPWTELIENATTLTQLEKLRERMQRYTVLDPACGAGNFLYLAYRELKRLEARLLERIGEMKRAEKGQRQLGFVTARQFFGIDINEFAVEIAKVTMMIARKLAIDELGIDERPLPLDNLDENFKAQDALIEPQRANGSIVHVTLFAEFETDPWASGAPVPTQWPPADVIIGNPPFAGSRYLPAERGYPYTRSVRRVYPSVPKMADYCVYWLRRAHDHLPVCTAEDPIAGRAGLVGTQNIRNNQSRVGGLDYIVKTGTLVEAVDNQPWSGEANVHVSIVNWVKRAPSPPTTPEEDAGGRRRAARRTRAASDDTAEPVQARAPHRGYSGAGPAEAALLIPPKRRLWYRVAARPQSPLFEPAQHDPDVEVSNGRPRRKDKTFELAATECSHISSSLSCETDVSRAARLACNTTPQRVFQGQNPANDHFMLPPDEARVLLSKNPKLRDVLFPYMIGRDLVTLARPARFIIDFAQRDMLKAARYPEAFERIKQRVMPAVLARAAQERTATGRKSTRWTRMAERWWQLRDQQPGMMAAIRRIPRYIVCSRTTKRPVFAFVSSRVHPDTKLMVFPFADDYTFGILQSSVHWKWFVTKSSKLTERFNYTPTSVWDTFPWPQAPRKKQIRAVAKAGREIRRIRAEALPRVTGGLRALYRTLELPGKNPLKDAHAALDAAVLDAYGFDPESDLLAQLLNLNLTVAARIDRGEPVTAPGVPPTYGDAAELITDDCIRP